MEEMVVKERSKGKMTCGKKNKRMLLGGELAFCLEGVSRNSKFFWAGVLLETLVLDEARLLGVFLD